MGRAVKRRTTSVTVGVPDTFRTASSRPRVSPKLLVTSADWAAIVSVCVWLQAESLKTFSASLRFHSFQGFIGFWARTTAANNAPIAKAMIALFISGLQKDHRVLKTICAHFRSQSAKRNIIERRKAIALLPYIKKGEERKAAPPLEDDLTSYR